MGYRFNCEQARHYMEDLIRSMNYSENESWFAEEYQNGDIANFGIAVLEADGIDIELNLTQYGAEYFICAKGKGSEWYSIGYVPDLAANADLPTGSFDWVVDVQFDEHDWEEELKWDMARVLNNVKEQLGDTVKAELKKWEEEAKHV